jgi:hypothetical protein
MIKANPRKIIQICTDSLPDSDIVINALCNDGTVWRLHYDDGRYSWRKLNNIPQE